MLHLKSDLMVVRQQAEVVAARWIGRARAALHRRHPLRRLYALRIIGILLGRRISKHAA